jgi:hypothetical protein
MKNSSMNSRGPAAVSCLNPWSRKESWTQVLLIQIALIQMKTDSNFARSEPPVFASRICPTRASAFEVPVAARSDSKCSGSGKWKSGKFDPALKPLRLLTRVNSGRSVLYETTFEHPAEPGRLHRLYAGWQIETDRVFHVFGRRLPPERYPLFSRNMTMDVLWLPFSKPNQPQPAPSLSSFLFLSPSEPGVVYYDPFL